MRYGKYTPDELKRVLKIDTDTYKRFVEVGMPYTTDDNGVKLHDLDECVQWIEDNTVGFGERNYAKIKLLEEANVVKAITNPVQSDYVIDDVMINDCECQVKTKDQVSTVKVLLEVDMPEDEVQSFAEAMTTLIYSYQEVTS